METYFRLFLVFTLIIELMTFITIYKAILTYNKKNPQKYSTLKFLFFCIISTVIIFATLFAIIFLF